ncbi:hypothetical protein HQ590_05990 [bacterium]|nr:hypothetical protein [bacterium]
MGRNRLFVTRRCHRWWQVGGALLVLAGAVPAAEHGGEITGTVRLAGPAPKVKYYAVERDRAVCGGSSRPVQALRLGPGQTVADAIVYLEGGRSVVSRRAAPAILDMQHCDFRPRIQVVRSDTPLVIRNSDPLLHVVRIDVVGATGPPQTVMRLAAPYAGYEKRLDLRAYQRSSLLRISGENGHGWMTAYLAVLPHPWAAVTDADGRFAITDVPAGRHRLFVWHERLGTMTRLVDLPRARGVEVTLEFSATR